MTWLYVPQTDSPCALAALDSIWDSCLQNRSSTPDAMSSGSRTPNLSSYPRRKVDALPLRQYGTTCEPSMDAPCGDTSTQSSPGIHASHSAPPGGGAAPTTLDTYIQTSSALSMKFGPAGYCSKTSKGTSALAQIPFCGPYSDWVTLLRQAYSARLKLVRRTTGSDGSAWPTPMAGTPAQNGNSAAGNSDFTRKTDQLARALWTTPQAHDVTRRGKGQKPSATAGNACLATDAALWSTPASRDWKGANSLAHSQRGKGHMGQLPNQATHGFTRPHLTTRQAGQMQSPQIQLARRLFRAAIPSVPHSISRAYSPPRKRANCSAARMDWKAQTSFARWKLRRVKWWTTPRLSPVFVEWLMGWPAGHALCDCSETAFTLWLRRMRGELLRLPTACGPWIWTERTVSPEPRQGTFDLMPGGTE